MALLEEMRTLVGDLELAASRRAVEERARQEAAARDAHERAARTANRRAEVGKTLGGFHRERATVAWLTNCPTNVLMYIHTCKILSTRTIK